MRPISASGPASPKLVGERRGEQGVARGVPPPGIFPADLDGRFPNHALHRFRAVTPAGSVISERRIRAAPSAARWAPRCPVRPHRGQPWRERPRDLTASAIMPAATVEVAHATVEWCHRIRRRAQTAPQGTQILMASEAIHRGFRSAFPPWFSDSDSETAGAARGAATKSGGWRSSGRLSCQSKPMVDEPVSGKAAFASLFTLTTCTLRSRTLSAAFCVAHETHFARAPAFIATAAPRPSRRVAHALVSVSRSLAECSSDLRAVCTCVVRCVHAADHTGIAVHFQHTSAKVLALLRPSHRQRRAVLGLVKTLRYAPTRCAGLRALTTPARSSEVALM